MNIESLRDKIQELTGYRFKDINILKVSITHSSYVHEHGLNFWDCNERLEFLGDAILDLIVGEYLFLSDEKMNEGSLTKERAKLVNKDVLADAAKVFNLGQCLLLGHGEEITGGREKDSILADAMEAFIGAMYLDGGFDVAKDLILSHFIPILNTKAFEDYKSKLQEFTQKRQASPIYSTEIINKDKDSVFKTKVFAFNRRGIGIGHNKKESEHMAAKDLLKKLGEL